MAKLDEERKILAEIIDELSSKAESVKKLDVEEIEKKILEKINPRFEELNAKLDEKISQLLEAIKQERRGRKPKEVVAMEEKFESLEERISAFEEKFKELDRIAGLERMLEDVRKELERKKKREEASSLFGEMPMAFPSEKERKEMKERIAKLETALEELSRNLNEIRPKVSKLEGESEVLSVIPEIQKQVNKLREVLTPENTEKIKRLLASIDQIISDEVKAAIKQSLRSLNREMNELRKAVEDNKERGIKALNSFAGLKAHIKKFDDLFGEIRILSKEIRHLRSEIKAAEEISMKRDERLMDEIIDRKSETRRLADSILNLIDKFDSLTSSLTQIFDQIKRIEQRIMSLEKETKNFALRSEVEKTNEELMSLERDVKKELSKLVEKVERTKKTFNFLIREIEKSRKEKEIIEEELERNRQELKKILKGMGFE